MNDLYTYIATVHRVLDGDTAELTIDLGFTIYWRSTCRFYGVNAPELTAKDAGVRIRALESKRGVQDHLGVGQKIKIVSKDLDKYGRPLVDIYCGEAMDFHLNQWLVDSGLAVKYTL
jgi:micrococcal nuclease